MKFAFDTGIAVHRVRRWWWKVTRRKAGAMTRCYDCGAKLTAEEITYYGWGCERCEGLAHEQTVLSLRESLERIPPIGESK